MPARRKRGNRVKAIRTMPMLPDSCQLLTARPVLPALWPAMPTNCSVEILAATMDRPISGQVSPRPARK